ncbi:MAG: ABC transporter permease [Hyphomicrobiales bacterium]|nr:ABC transporter permease [Hyphomicrobiales bacterium]
MRLLHDRVLALAALLVAAALGICVLGPWIAPYDPLTQSIAARLQGPGALHWLGTDQLGRDILARIFFGTRATLIGCVLAVGFALGVGGAIGIAAAFLGGWFERIAMRIMDVIFAFPVMLLAIGIIAMLGPRDASATVAIAIIYTPIFARLLRGPALVICETEYVKAARAIGASPQAILFRHVVPNLASVILVQTSLLLSSAILVEASLSFLGLGAQPPAPSLGLMLAEGRNFLMLSPWSAVFAGIAILLLAFGFNLLGDALRDRLDPRLART